MARSEKVMTPEFRVSFPNLFKARAAAPGQDPKFSISALFPAGADLSELKRIASEVVKEEWGDKPPANLRSPFKDQGEKTHYEGYEPGNTYITASSKRRPGVVDINVQPIIDESEFYPGCYARMTVVAFTYRPTKDNPAMRPGVAFGIQNVQKTAEGEPLGGGSRPEDDFGDPSGAPRGAQREAEPAGTIPW